MNHTTRLDAARLVRLAALTLTIAGATAVYLAYRPRIEALRIRIHDTESALRSGEIAVSEMARLRRERDVLAARYAHLFDRNAEGVFLRELAATTRARGVTLVSSSLTQEPATSRGGERSELFTQTRANLELRGSYRNVLATIAALSAGSEIIGVDAPSLRRDGTDVIATVPVTIYEPGSWRKSAP